MSIERGRLGLSYHLSLAEPDAFPSAGAIKLAAYSYVSDERAPIAAELTELAAALLHEAEQVAERGPGWNSHVFLTTCAALAPALAAPGGPVSQLLSYFDPWLDDAPSLRVLAKTAADVSMTGVHLPLDLLREAGLTRKVARKRVGSSQRDEVVDRERASIHHQVPGGHQSVETNA